MQGDRDVLVFHDERMMAHDPNIEVPFLPGRLDKRVREILNSLGATWKYPEHPGRLAAVMKLLQERPVPGVRMAGGKAASRDQLARVHTLAYLDNIEEMRGINAWLDVDTTAVSPGSIEAAEVAAGTAIAAVDAVISGETRSAFALVRPPGHHAEPVRARGFCFFNNVAVAAAHAQAALGCKRVLIIDWDAHHGNGTQEIFWSDPDVMFFDTHRAAPFYPGSGNLDETGGGYAEGTIVNVPLPDGTGDTAMVKAFRDILVPAADYFGPDLVQVSAGFDAHRFDLAMNVSYEGFAALTGIVQGIADRHCDGRLVMVLEGGYYTESLAHGVRAVLEVLSGGQPVDPGEIGVAGVHAATLHHRDAFIADK